MVPASARLKKPRAGTAAQITNSTKAHAIGVVIAADPSRKKRAGGKATTVNKRKLNPKPKPRIKKVGPNKGNSKLKLTPVIVQPTRCNSIMTTQNDTSKNDKNSRVGSGASNNSNLNMGVVDEPGVNSNGVSGKTVASSTRKPLKTTERILIELLKVKRPKKDHGSGKLSRQYEAIAEQHSVTVGTVKNLVLEVKEFKLQKKHRDLRLNSRDLNTFENGLVGFIAGRHLSSIIKQVPGAYGAVKNKAWFSDLLGTRIVRVHRLVMLARQDPEEDKNPDDEWCTVASALRYPTAEIIAENSSWNHRLKKIEARLLPQFQNSISAATDKTWSKKDSHRGLRTLLRTLYSGKGLLEFAETEGAQLFRQTFPRDKKGESLAKGWGLPDLFEISSLTKISSESDYNRSQTNSCGVLLHRKFNPARRSSNEELGRLRGHAGCGGLSQRESERDEEDYLSSNEDSESGTDRDSDEDESESNNDEVSSEKISSTRQAELVNVGRAIERSLQIGRDTLPSLRRLAELNKKHERDETYNLEYADYTSKNLQIGLWPTVAEVRMPPGPRQYCALADGRSRFDSEFNSSKMSCIAIRHMLKQPIEKAWRRLKFVEDALLEAGVVVPKSLSYQNGSNVLYSNGPCEYLKDVVKMHFGLSAGDKNYWGYGR